MILSDPMRTLALTALLFITAGCGGSDDDGAKSKLATDLVACKNDVTTLKEQLAQAKADLHKAQAAADTAVKLAPVDIGPTPTVKHMEGNVSPDAVVKVVRTNSGGLRACYERALKRKPDLQYVSTVVAHFQVKNSGGASQVSFSPHTDAEMEHCMAGAMEKWKFPTFQGDPVAFEQPVNLVAK